MKKDNKYIFIQFISPVVLAVILFILFPNNIQIFLRELVYFLLSNFIKYIYIFVIIFVLFFLVKNGFKKINLLKIERIIKARTVLIILLISIILSNIISFYSMKLLEKSIPHFSLTFGGFYTHNAEGTLIIKDEDEYLNNLFFSKIVNLAKSHFAFEKIISIERVNIPKMLPPILGISGIQKLLKKNNYLATIYFIRKNENQNYETIINENIDVLDNTNMEDINQFCYLVLKKSNFSDDINLEIVASFVLAQFGQSVTQGLVWSKRLTEAHLVLNNSEELIYKIIGKLNEKINSQEGELNSIADFLKIKILSNYMYLRSQVFIEDKNYDFALKSIFDTIYLSDSCPYANLEDFKINLTKRYILENLADMKSEKHPQEVFNYFADLHIKKLSESVKFKKILLPNEVISKILYKSNHSKAICKSLEESLTNLVQLKKNNPIYWYYYGELIRYLPKGTDKYNDLFIDRLSASNLAFQKALLFDNKFELINIKLGANYINEGRFYLKKNKIKLAKTKMDRGAIYYKKGLELLVKNRAYQ